MEQSDSPHSLTSLPSPTTTDARPGTKIYVPNVHKVTTSTRMEFVVKLDLYAANSTVLKEFVKLAIKATLFPIALALLQLKMLAAHYGMETLA